MISKTPDSVREVKDAISHGVHYPPLNQIKQVFKQISTMDTNNPESVQQATKDAFNDNIFWEALPHLVSSNMQIAYKNKTNPDVVSAVIAPVHQSLSNIITAIEETEASRLNN